MSAEAVETTLPAGVTSYRDRHGKARWRLRRQGTTISLAGQPGSAEFEIALEAALSGRPSLTSERRRLALRRNALLQNYCDTALRRARQRARDKGVSFDLNRDDFARLIESQHWACAVSHIPFALQRMDGERQQNAFRPSLDRISPKIGYVVGNVRIVCEIVNFAMSDWGEAPLLELIKKGRWRT